MWKSSDAPEEDGAKFGSMSRSKVEFLEPCYNSDAIFEAKYGLNMADGPFLMTLCHFTPN
jgi:hypothetical protein